MEGLDGALGAHRHEDGSLDFGVSSGEGSGPSFGFGICGGEAKHRAGAESRLESSDSPVERGRILFEDGGTLRRGQKVEVMIEYEEQVFEVSALSSCSSRRKDSVI